MKFYNREKELKLLANIKERSHAQSTFTVVTGRRRIGKTQLLLEANKGTTFLYFFVAKKSEILLCQDFQQEISTKLGIPILGTIESFATLFQYVMDLSRERNLTLIIDEFQEFQAVNSSVYSDMQRIWDLNKDQTHLNLIVSGSVQSLMNKIFQDSKEPLFGRATHFLHLKPFTTNTLIEIISSANPTYTPEDLLALYSFTGGVAKYVEYFIDQGWTSKDKMITGIFLENSIYYNEGRTLLIEEFGKDYSIYFSILTAIADGFNTRSLIENLLKREIGGYLTKLEKDYNLISKKLPVLAKNSTRNAKYMIEDNFLIFWFRFIYRYAHIVEIGAYEQFTKIVTRDYTTFSGLMLEKFYREKAIESGEYTRIGSFWDRKGETEIDFISINEIDKKIDFAEIKRKADNISFNQLKIKIFKFIELHPQVQEYQISTFAWSLEEIDSPFSEIKEKTILD